MKVVFWLNQFPAVSETFIRDQIIGILNNHIDVTIFTSYKNSDVSSIKGLVKYSLMQRTIKKDSILPRNWFLRLSRMLSILIANLLTANSKFYLRSLNFLRFKRTSMNLRLFYQTHFILKENPDVIHAHFGNNGMEAAYLKSIGLPFKLITTFHGFDIRKGISEDNSYYDLLIDQADSILSISKYNRQNLMNFGFKHDQILDLNNGIDIEFFKPSDKKDNSLDTIQIISVGRLTDEKAFDLAIKSIKNILKEFTEQEIHLTIIGEGPEYAELKGLIDSLHLKNNITLAGKKSSTEVRNMLQKSDFFLLSSKAESLPTVILEAQACGLPIVSSNVGSILDIVKEGIHGYTADPTVNDLTKA
ncbi:MAG: glycosyltransferase, partial [Flavobacteriaceae bacterium]|nr:glycosyltransferase [Bacteroidia bacterium]NNL60741.1 glycosyltransferase [Flavobacteriaceae bacterium]